jgi:hemerythrin
MSSIKKTKIINGVYWVEVAEAGLSLLCGCPADAVKHLKKRGLIEEVERAGLRCETGPNAILLSDVLMQNGSFSNLTEFPVLQMLYLQGMILPGHPNNTGAKPLLVGAEAQVRAQMEYIFRGNYGLVSVAEIMDAGIDQAAATAMFNLKMRFAFGQISRPEQLIDCQVLADAPVELRPGVSVARIGFNRFRVAYAGEAVEVDLNLADGETYEPPYQLGHHLLRREYFAVVHSGEGDGWDVNRPCMASILMFQGKIYLIDAGPNILTSLNCLGISVNEIEGIFHTHAHDDHFAGLTTLIRTDHRFKYFATPLVRAAVTKKLCALMPLSEDNFSYFFDIHDLVADQWNPLDGLEVMPMYSPHPVETNVFYFRAHWLDGYKTYAHLADITALKALQKMVETPQLGQPLAPDLLARVHETYFAPADLKKIDAGGGLIHGDAEDFATDPSPKIVLAHLSRPLTQQQREIGSSAGFGMVDVLIPANHDLLADVALRHLQFYFPHAPAPELRYLLNHPVQHYNAGTILLRRGSEVKSVYLLLTGAVEYVDSTRNELGLFPAGSLIGFYSATRGQPSPETYRASCHLTVLEFPLASYQQFVARNALHADLRRMEEHMLFLEQTWLFGEVVSFPILAKLARQMERLVLPPGLDIDLYDREHRHWHPDEPPVLFVLAQGTANLVGSQPGRPNDWTLSLNPGDFFGGEPMLLLGLLQRQFGHLRAMAGPAGTTLYYLPAKVAVDIPIAHWKMLETYEKRYAGGHPART